MLLSGVSIVWGAVGLALLIWGWRGRLVDDHPHCRGCGFDLFGSSPDASSCSECGRDLNARRAIRDGGREKRKRWVTVGLVLGLSAASVFISDKLRAGTWPAAYAVLPDAVLVWMVETAEAREEIIHRLDAGEFGVSSTDRVVDLALDRQGDRSLAWETSWGAIVESAAAAGMVRPADLERYATQASGFVLALRSKIKAGFKPVCYVTGTPDRRIGPNVTVSAMLQINTLEINGSSSQAPLSRLFSRIRIADGGVGRTGHHLPMDQFPEQLGAVTIEVSVKPRYSLSLSSAASPLHSFWAAGQKVSATTEVVDDFTGNYVTQGRNDQERADGTAVWFGTKTSLSRVMHFATRQPEPLNEELKYWLRFHESGQMVEVYPLNRSWVSPSSQLAVDHHLEVQIGWDDFSKLFREEKSADLIVRANFKMAEAGTSTQPVWLGEWVMKDVPLDADPVSAKWNPFGSGSPPSLVNATARTLTPEEAAVDPR